MRHLTLKQLQSMKQEKTKIAMLALYDATFAQIAGQAGVDILFIGDSLGMVVKGEQNTLSVTTEEIAYHTACVARQHQTALVLSDLPFMTYSTPDIAAKNATPLLQAGAEIVKLEGGSWLAETVYFLTERGIPVCGHIGLTPQYIHLLGGYQVQGRDENQAKSLLDTAITLEAAGARLLVLECVPYRLAQEITQKLHIPVIGIGAGPYCDGQVLVVYDMLGITPGKPKKFVKNFLLESHTGILGAIQGYTQAVKEHHFPTLEHSFE